MRGREIEIENINLTNKFPPAGVFCWLPLPKKKRNVFDEFECEILMAKYETAARNRGKVSTEQTRASVMSLSSENHSSCVYSLLVRR